LFKRRPGDAHALRIFLDREGGKNPSDPAFVQSWSSRFREALEKSRFDEKEPVLKTWFEQKKNLFSSIELDKNVLTLVLSLLTLVAALNIAATLVVLFLERDREIATLQALGLSTPKLVQWICVQGLFLGILSAGLGLLFARLFGWILQRLPISKLPSDIYNISSLPLYFAPEEQFWIFFFGVGAAVLVSLFLGFALSKQKPAVVLGHRR
jgi:lipoprotein-releasing system permease protein